MARVLNPLFFSSGPSAEVRSPLKDANRLKKWKPSATPSGVKKQKPGKWREMWKGVIHPNWRNNDALEPKLYPITTTIMKRNARRTKVVKFLKCKQSLRVIYLPTASGVWDCLWTSVREREIDEEWGRVRGEGRRGKGREGKGVCICWFRHWILVKQLKLHFMAERLMN